jgi:acyl-coenzyme A thioesterase PaaI-like protein
MATQINTRERQKRMNRLKRIKETLKIRVFGFVKIPLIWLVSPSVIDVGVERTEIVIPLNRRTKNHLNSMYFGALAIGADLAGGVLFMNLMAEAGIKASFVFKDMSAQFLKRADGDVHFVSLSGKDVQALIKRVVESPERQETTVVITATVPKKYGEEPVAIFHLTLSVKRLK